jgi:hypothetical protein
VVYTEVGYPRAGQVANATDGGGQNSSPVGAVGWLDGLRRVVSSREGGFHAILPHPLESGAKVLGMNMLRPKKQLLLFLVVKKLEFRCGDPRDDVFALVGIASDAVRFVLIDYGSPTEKVCRQLAYAYVSESMSLKLLWSLVYLAVEAPGAFLGAQPRNRGGGQGQEHLDFPVLGLAHDQGDGPAWCSVVDAPLDLPSHKRPSTMTTVALYWYSTVKYSTLVINPLAFITFVPVFLNVKCCLASTWLLPYSTKP